MTVRKKLAALYHGLVSVLLCAGVLLPILYIVQLSFRRMPDVMKNTLFFAPTLENYFNIFTEKVNYLPFVSVLKNSVLVTLISVFIALSLACLAAYSLARLRVRHRMGINYLILGMRMIPPIAIVVPLYIIWAKIGLYDSLTGLILPFVALDIPLSTWLLQGFFKGIPENLEEAAAIDGCSRFQAFYRIILPLTAPGIAATSIFSFSLSWNDLTIPMALTLTGSPTLPVLSAQVKTDDGILWGQLGAYAVLMIVPMVIFTACVSRFLVKGMASGAVKE
jgi:ABC-type glycerol-3-phosphate transport system permease component